MICATHSVATYVSFSQHFCDWLVALHNEVWVTDLPFIQLIFFFIYTSAIFIIFLDSTELKIVSKKMTRFFKGHLSMIPLSFSS